MVMERLDEQKDTIEAIRRALNNLRFGTVEITVHDARVVMIERRERVRLNTEQTATVRR